MRKRHTASRQRKEAAIPEWVVDIPPNSEPEGEKKADIPPSREIETSVPGMTFRVMRPQGNRPEPEARAVPTSLNPNPFYYGMGVFLFCWAIPLYNFLTYKGISAAVTSCTSDSLFCNTLHTSHPWLAGAAILAIDTLFFYTIRELGNADYEQKNSPYQFSRLMKEMNEEFDKEKTQEKYTPLEWEIHNRTPLPDGVMQIVGNYIENRNSTLTEFNRPMSRFSSLEQKLKRKTQRHFHNWYQEGWVGEIKKDRIKGLDEDEKETSSPKHQQSHLQVQLR